MLIFSAFRVHLFTKYYSFRIIFKVFSSKLVAVPALIIFHQLDTIYFFITHNELSTIPAATVTATTPRKITSSVPASTIASALLARKKPYILWYRPSMHYTYNYLKCRRHLPQTVPLLIYFRLRKPLRICRPNTSIFWQLSLTCVKATIVK